MHDDGCFFVDLVFVVARKACVPPLSLCRLLEHALYIKKEYELVFNTTNPHSRQFGLFCFFS